MIIKRVAIGNKLECFIENRIEQGVNIIFSDDNILLCPLQEQIQSVG